MQLVYGSAPIAGHPRPVVNSCQVSCLSRYLDLQKDRADLTELVNRCQRHIYTENYCLRRDRATGRMKCRFRFLHKAKQHPEIAKNDKNQRVFLLLSQDCDRDIDNYITAQWYFPSGHQADRRHQEGGVPGRGGNNSFFVVDRDTGSRE